MNTIKNIFRFFFGFKGRIGRLHYALSLLVLTVISLIMVGFPTVISQNISYSIMRGTFASAEVVFLTVVFALVALLLILKYSHIVRRVHDLNKKATASNLFQTILWIDIISLFTLFITSDIKILVNLAMTVIHIGCIIALAVKKGNEGKNDFGKPQIPFWKKTNS
ncbi:hypothetical protein RO21_07620 [[Actinobacillus] muris]|uniref:DUF805 domain-containing protein n=1 Tax=Muribacter muris TaxID=67855 RepID=A0A0J5P4H8_9PAST|nr:DUF805 domain-containing protein [Muribacter muris]KMK51206.1 hypothetical protein RO21_07620 [[Actinobacillus] muris] [Muribacter muris]